MSFKDQLNSRFNVTETATEGVDESVTEGVADTRLRQLGTAGLFDVKKIQQIKRALRKDPTQMTTRERAMLISSFETLLGLVTSNQQLFQRTKGELQEEELQEANSWTELKDPPPVLILRRRAIRIFPDDRRVALYFADALNKFIGIPYGDKTLVTETTIAHGDYGNYATEHGAHPAWKDILSDHYHSLKQIKTDYPKGKPRADFFAHLREIKKQYAELAKKHGSNDPYTIHKRNKT